MKLLSIAGTAAMFLVGGGIIVHGVPWLHHLLESWARGAAGLGRTLIDMGFNAGVGVLVGGVVVGVLALVRKLRWGPAAAH